MLMCELEILVLGFYAAQLCKFTLASELMKTVVQIMSNALMYQSISRKYCVSLIKINIQFSTVLLQYDQPCHVCYKNWPLSSNMRFSYQETRITPQENHLRNNFSINYVHTILREMIISQKG